MGRGDLALAGAGAVGLLAAALLAPVATPSGNVILKRNGKRSRLARAGFSPGHSDPERDDLVRLLEVVGHDVVGP